MAKKVKQNKSAKLHKTKKAFIKNNQKRGNHFPFPFSSSECYMINSLRGAMLSLVI